MRTLLTLCLSLFISSSVVLAQDDAAAAGSTNTGSTTSIKKRMVKDSIFFLQGKGGNIGVSVGKDGILMIDSQFENATPEILAHIRALSKKPIQFLVNTHHHGDHVGGNKNLKEEGVVIYSHKNARERMGTGFNEKLVDSISNAYENKVSDIRSRSGDIEAEKATKRIMERELAKVKKVDGLPMITFSKDMTFHYNGQDILVFHVDKAHTDGDVMIYFTKSNVIHTGDAYINGKYPFIDTKNGGTPKGYLAALDKLLMLADDETKIIPGHGGMATKKDVKETQSMIKYLRERIAFHLLSGKSLAEVQKLEDVAKPFNEKGFDGGFISAEKFVTTLYEEAQRRYPQTKKNSQEFEKKRAALKKQKGDN